MTSKFFSPLLTAGLLLGAAATARWPPMPPSAPKLTHAVARALSAAQKANNKKDYPGRAGRH